MLFNQGNSGGGLVNIQVRRRRKVLCGHCMAGSDEVGLYFIQEVMLRSFVP